jgi:hypothetical protein
VSLPLALRTRLVSSSESRKFTIGVATTWPPDASGVRKTTVELSGMSYVSLVVNGHHALESKGPRQIGRALCLLSVSACENPRTLGRLPPRSGRG